MMVMLTALISLVLFATVSADLGEIYTSYAATDLPGLDECGFETIERIVGGTEARAGEFPWVAALQFNKKDTEISSGIRCGGSVLNRRYVLTAGHCLFPLYYDLVSVWLGVWKISTAETTDKDKVVKFGIEEKIRHEDFDEPGRTYDIGLLRLDADITYTDYIRPTCLPSIDLALPPYGTKLIVTGWGVTDTGMSSDIKLKVSVPVIENSVCEKQLKVTMIDSQMCAGSEAGKDSCESDSGGPLMKNGTHPVTGRVHWFPHGIVSFGPRKCGQKDVPAAYTRVSKFMNWIISKVR